MKTRMMLLGGLSALALAPAALAAAPPLHDNWVGSWGFVSAPLPPGLTPTVTIPAPVSTAVPMGALPPAPASPPPAALPPAFQPLLDNPGGVPVDIASTDLTNVTVRQAVRLSAGGRRLRLRLSNEGGADALTLDSLHVGEAGPDGSIVPGSDRVVTFDGHAGVTAPASSPILSDPIDLPTRALEKLYISIHAPGVLSPRAPRTLYQYVAGRPGDATAQAQLPQARLARVPALVTLVEVDASVPTGVVVALGDSITEGATSTGNAFRGWPDRLAERIAGKNWAVVNAGISGNRLLRYGAGPTALARLDRDVLSVPGVKAVILMEGINDIGRGFSPVGATEPATLEALKAADKQIIARAHEKGLRVIGATLTPYQGASYASPAGEAVREALNEWIRTSGAFDGVIDFSPVVADPNAPLAFAAQYNTRDHLHPNDNGYKAMGDSIDLTVITGK
jgi:lysophospholipase L1-like esterase